MKLHALPAAKGDCLILEHGEPADPKLIVVDGGPAGVYTTLRKRLLVIRDARIAAGQLGADDPLLIDLLLVSHVDDDHINGIEAMLREMLQRQKDHEQPLFVVGRLWHNSFGRLIDAQALIATPGAVTAAVDAHDEGDDDDQHDLSLILASVEQGFNVLALAAALGIPVNPEFAAGLVIADKQPIDVDGLSVTVIGPMLPELKALQVKFATWLAAHPGKTITASVLASFDDTSPANLSSIVLLVDDGQQKLLLTGDARGDKIMTSVKALNLLAADGRLAVEILKVPHHGSDRNTAASFFAMFPSPYYIFSGNGEHGNPERKTLDYLNTGRGGAAVTIELTYAPMVIDTGRELDWNTKKLPRKPALGPWKPADYGIVAYLATTPNITVVHP